MIVVFAQYIILRISIYQQMEFFLRILRFLFSRTCLEICLGLVALGAFVVAIEANTMTREGLRHGQIVGAWQVISTPAPGNTGKKDALELLHSAGQSLNGIDLSCSRMSGQEGWEADVGICDAPVDLTGLSLDPIPAGFGRAARVAELHIANLTGANLSRSTMRSANLGFANLSGATFFKAELSEVNLYRASLSHAVLSEVSFANADLEDADLSSAYLFDVDLTGAILTGVNLSRTSFCHDPGRTPRDDCDIRITQEQLLSAWTWEDRLPVLNSAITPPTCPSSLRADYEAQRRPVGRPEGC